MATQDKKTIGLERFSGNKSDFQTWKDKVVTYILEKDQDYIGKMLEKDRAEQKYSCATSWKVHQQSQWA